MAESLFMPKTHLIGPTLYLLPGVAVKFQNKYLSPEFTLKRNESLCPPTDVTRMAVTAKPGDNGHIHPQESG